MPYDGGNGFDRNLLSPGHQHLRLVAQGQINFSCGHQLQGVIAVSGHLDIHVQTFFGEIAILLCGIQEGVDRVRIPVEHYGQLVARSAFFGRSRTGRGSIVGWSTAAGSNSKTQQQ
ncbi:hypothetical protein D3C75_1123420 [compost metagenome]